MIYHLPQLCFLACLKNLQLEAVEFSRISRPYSCGSNKQGCFLSQGSRAPPPKKNIRSHQGQKFDCLPSLGMTTNVVERCSSRFFLLTYIAFYLLIFLKLETYQVWQVGKVFQGPQLTIVESQVLQLLTFFNNTLEGRVKVLYFDSIEAESLN